MFLMVESMSARSVARTAKRIPNRSVSELQVEVEVVEVANPGTVT